MNWSQSEDGLDKLQPPRINGRDMKTQNFLQEDNARENVGKLYYPGKGWMERNSCFFDPQPTLKTNNFHSNTMPSMTEKKIIISLFRSRAQKISTIKVMDVDTKLFCRKRSTQMLVWPDQLDIWQKAFTYFSFFQKPVIIQPEFELKHQNKIA